MLVKKILKSTLPDAWFNYLKDQWVDPYVYKNWEKQGRPVPPPHIIKQKVIQEFQSRFQLDTLVETGTFRGVMIEAQLRFFKKIISVELDEKLFQEAVKKFRPFPKVSLLQGDSGQVLPDLVPQLEEAVLFWLDGHYSHGVTAKGDLECPIYEELKAIFKSPFSHIILIDDARCFTGENDYPTLAALEAFVHEHRPEYQMQVEADLIRMYPLASN